jgi:glucosamine--fructose-6-phosphate aminotransferase (isomerizing)
MCGIFAYIGNRECLEMLITALRRLEYRGYDSAGVALHNGSCKDSVRVVKEKGRVDALAGRCGGGVKGSCGVAHTRWATHGKPSTENAHPHVSAGTRCAVVHNGIIENFKALRDELKSNGCVFKSETDTEVLPHLFNKMANAFPNVSKVEIVAKSLRLVRGTYGIVVVFEDEPDLIIGARQGSPLIMGIADGEHYLASDASAIVEHTKEVLYLDDGDIVSMSRSKYEVFKIMDLVESGKPYSPVRSEELNITTLEWSLDEIEKEGYEHFMLKEIHDQPNSLMNCIRGRVFVVAEPEEPNSPALKRHISNNFFDGEYTPLRDQGEAVDLGLQDDLLTGPKDRSRKFKRSNSLDSNKWTDGIWGIKLRGLSTDIGGKTALERMCEARRIIICACGTSWHAGLIGEYVLESLARIPVEVEYASEFRYRDPILFKDDVIVVISQSGETADSLESVRIAKKNGVPVIGLVNTVGSTIARESDAGVYLHAGPEIGVASTKAFSAQVMVLCMVALRVATKKGEIDQDTAGRIAEELYNIPKKIDKMLKQTDKIAECARFLKLASNFLYLGRGVNFPVALEGALKTKEISYIHAEGYPAAEMKHGPIALIDRLMPVVCIAPKRDPFYEKVYSNIMEVKARDATIIVITEEDNTDFDSMADYVLRTSETEVLLYPLLAVVPLQMLAYYIAKERGCEIDKPRNLAKSVTVE